MGETGAFIARLLTIFTGTGLGLWYVSKMLRGRQEKLLRDFRHRDSQPQGLFLERCGIAAGTDQARLAIGIREALADLGNVAAELLYAEDRFDGELEPLPFCHRFYVADFADLLSKKTGIKLSGKQMELPHPDVPPKGMTVADFVQRVLSNAKVRGAGTEK